MRTFVRCISLLRGYQRVRFCVLYKQNDNCSWAQVLGLGSIGGFQHLFITVNRAWSRKVRFVIVGDIVRSCFGACAALLRPGKNGIKLGLKLLFGHCERSREPNLRKSNYPPVNACNRLVYFSSRIVHNAQNIRNPWYNTAKGHTGARKVAI